VKLGRINEQYAEVRDGITAGQQVKILQIGEGQELLARAGIKTSIDQPDSGFGKDGKPRPPGNGNGQGPGQGRGGRRNNGGGPAGAQRHGGDTAPAETGSQTSTAHESPTPTESRSQTK
jgi:hypothetical protein